MPSINPAVRITTKGCVTWRKFGDCGLRRQAIGQGEKTSDAGEFPGWVPDAVAAYLRHTGDGLSIRRLARQFGCQPSTISRRIRRIEIRRDDRLVDLALTRLGRSTKSSLDAISDCKELHVMSKYTQLTIPDESKFEREALRVLRRMAEPGACMALADAMENAVVVRDTDDGPAVRTAVVERTVAEAMAIKDWIEASGSGRVMRYRITSAGRAALRDFVAREESSRVMSVGTAMEDDGHGAGDGADEDEKRQRKVRYNLAESPLVALSRRRDKGGEPFLSEGLVGAGERLREDFELAQFGHRVSQQWDAFINGTAKVTGLDDGKEVPAGVQAARERVAAALEALGPGLGDVALRCCCYLEGLESAERRMGWSARSGKIVLRISLQRLRLHYENNAEHWSPLIG